MVLKDSCRQTNNLPGVSQIQQSKNLQYNGTLNMTSFVYGLQFSNLTSPRNHYLPQSDWFNVSCKSTKLEETVISYALLLNKLTSTQKHWFLKPGWLHEPAKQSHFRKLKVVSFISCYFKFFLQTQEALSYKAGVF